MNCFACVHTGLRVAAARLRWLAQPKSIFQEAP
jgi:hypothetical protein